MDPKYYWTPSSELPIDDFLKKRKPSLWIFVGMPDGRDPDAVSEEDNAQAKAIGAAQVALANLMKELDRIEKDTAIPARASKGMKGKKAVRDEALAAAVETFKKISTQYDYKHGKWMLFPRHDGVDRVWGQIARSIAHGPLKAAGVKTAKVASSDGNNDPGHIQLICIYFDDVYDFAVAKKIFTVLLTEHGIEANSCKSDLYTSLGIDSKHPSKLRSTIWRPNELIDGGAAAIKDLKEQYDPAKEVARSKDAADKPTSEGASAPAHTTKRSVSFDELPAKTKRKAASPEKTGKEKAPVKRVKSAARAFKENDIFAGSDGEDE